MAAPPEITMKDLSGEWVHGMPPLLPPLYPFLDSSQDHKLTPPPP